MADFVVGFTNLCMVAKFGEYEKNYFETMDLVNTSS